MTMAEPSVDLCGLDAGDAEWFDQIAIAKRASAAGSKASHRAQQEAEANGLEALAAALRDPVTRGVPAVHRGRGHEIAPADAPDMPWRLREMAQTVGSTPKMLASDASLTRLGLARSADVLALAVEMAESDNATKQALAARD